jgi:hypothetical protein
LGAEVPALQVALARPGVRVQLANGRSRRGRVFTTSNKNKKISKVLETTVAMWPCFHHFKQKEQKNYFLKLLLIAEEVLETT